MNERLGHFDKSCIYSTVKNTCGQTRRFGFLPPHGVQLDPNEVYTVFGSIYEAVGQGPDYATGQRNHKALAAALDRGDLVIVSTPAPILVDATSGASKMLHLNNGTLSAVNPCWQTSDSLDVIDDAA
jgi:hypothetical protein